jgi:hypothetical protein
VVVARRSFIRVKQRGQSAETATYRRLYAEQTGTIPVRDVEAGLVSLITRSCSFRSEVTLLFAGVLQVPVEEKYRPRIPVLPLATDETPAVMLGHESAVELRPSPRTVYEYRSGHIPAEAPTMQRPHTPLRIVRHRVRGRKHNSKNPEKNPPGVSRNVLGGFYAN